MKHKKQRRFQLPRLSFRIKVVLGVIAALILITVVTVVIIRLQAGKGNTEADDQYQQIIREAEADGRLRNQAKAEISKGNEAAADEVYQQAIVKERDVNKKIELYIDLANVLYDTGRPYDAIDTVKKAEALSDDKFLAADWLSRAYESQDDYVSAIKYYKLAGQSVASPQNEYLFEKSYYDREVARVMRLQGRGN